MPPSHHRLIRFAGLGVCSTLLLLRVAALWRDHTPMLGGLMHHGFLVWMLLYCIGLNVQTGLRGDVRSMRLLFLAMQSISIAGMMFSYSSAYLGYLLLITTWEALCILPERGAMMWTAAQTVAVASTHLFQGLTTWAWIITGICILFKCFTYLMAFTLRREADAREQQSALNGELIATRHLVAGRSRTAERLRISRDMHDVLGHHLTALSLNLEAGIHAGPDHNPHEELLRAREITGTLLKQVRDIVSVMREENAPSLRSDLNALATSFDRLKVHITTPDAIDHCAPETSRILVRCAQELITNTVKHTQAQNLYIEITQKDQQMLHIHSWDDQPAQHIAIPSKGYGLRSMQERFEESGGSVEVSQDETTGFQIFGKLPMLVGA